jgi:hypothetical protein
MSEAREIKFESPNNSNEVYVKLKELTPAQAEGGRCMVLQTGSSIEGFLKGTRLSTGKYPGRTEFLIESLDGSQVFVINKAGNLGKAIERKGINVGDALQIVYRGKSKATTGQWAGTDMHNFSVYGEDSSED